MKARIRLGGYWYDGNGGYALAKAACPTYTIEEAEKIRDRLRKQGFNVEVVPERPIRSRSHR